MRRIYEIIMPNGDVYGVPAEVIANNYAKHYESKGEDYKENFDVMIHWFDTSDFEFADWAKNNMDWDDVNEMALLLRRSETSVDFQDGWVNGQYTYRIQDEIKNI